MFPPRGQLVDCVFRGLFLLSLGTSEVFVAASDGETEAPHHETQAHGDPSTEEASSPAVPAQYLACDNQIIKAGEVDFWGEFVGPVRRFHLDSGVALNESRQYHGFTQKILALEGRTEQVAEECLSGTLVLFLQSLAAAEHDFGLPHARDLLRLAQDLFAQVAGSAWFGRELFGSGADHETPQKGTRDYWDTAAIARSLRLFERVLLPERTPQPVLVPAPAAALERRGRPLRVYVYELPTDPGGATPKELLQQGRYLEAVGHGLSNCQFGMYGTEVAFHRYLQQAVVRVARPEDANLFFIPSYFKCIELLNWVDGFHQPSDGSETTPASDHPDGAAAPAKAPADRPESLVLLQQTMDFVKRSGPWFARNNGADHVVLFSWGRHPCAIAPDWQTIVGKNVIQLQVEDHCEDLNEKGTAPVSTFQAHKDVIIPGYTDPWRAKELKRQNRRLDQRRYLLTFHGRSPQNAASYENVTIRGEIVSQYENLPPDVKPWVAIGGFVEDYHELLGQSMFCLAPRGITPWTIHLYIAFLVGCIPVILSDHFRLPFSSFLDYASAAVRWPEQDFSLAALLDHLRNLLESGAATELKKQVDRLSCWFDYDLWDAADCSPYRGAMRQLQDRVDSLPRNLAPFSAAGPQHVKGQLRGSRSSYLVGFLLFHPRLRKTFATLRPLADFLEVTGKMEDVIIVANDYHLEELVTFFTEEKVSARIAVLVQFFPLGVADGYRARLADRGTVEAGVPQIVGVITDLGAFEEPSGV
ncbi:unnamed protein product [Amoebophrya sp. A120]|nr:unnamed protein product [Amoebophrya sp. A120]|eukprot:GSA120T00017531001.1